MKVSIFFLAALTTSVYCAGMTDIQKDNIAKDKLRDARFQKEIEVAYASSKDPVNKIFYKVWGLQSRVFNSPLHTIVSPREAKETTITKLREVESVLAGVDLSNCPKDMIENIADFKTRLSVYIDAIKDCDQRWFSADSDDAKTYDGDPQSIHRPFFQYTYKTGETLIEDIKAYHETKVLWRWSDDKKVFDHIMGWYSGKID